MRNTVDSSGADNFKLVIAKTMATPFLSKTGINALFILLYSYIIVPKLVMNSSDLSVVVAVFPATIVTIAVWFTFTNNVFS